MKEKLLKECLEILNLFDYVADEDSMSNSIFKATINEDVFFDLKHRIEKCLKESKNEDYRMVCKISCSRVNAGMGEHLCRNSHCDIRRTRTTKILLFKRS